MIRRVIEAMPSDTDIQKRDRALVAFVIVSGARDNAVASFRLKHVDPVARIVTQEPRDGVRTKFSKTLRTGFFPVGEDLVAIVTDWTAHLKDKLLFGPDDPAVPGDGDGLDAQGGFTAAGLSRTMWSSAEPIRASSAKPSRRPACPTTTRIPSGTRWRWSATTGGFRMKSGKHGARTWAMTATPPRSRPMARCRRTGRRS